MSDYTTIKAARKAGTLTVEQIKAALLAEQPGLAAAEATKAQTSAAYKAALLADNAAHKDLVDRRRHVSKLTRWLGQAEGTIPADSVFDPYAEGAEEEEEEEGEEPDEEEELLEGL